MFSECGNFTLVRNDTCMKTAAARRGVRDQPMT
jgi:hypothetical protein